VITRHGRPSASPRAKHCLTHRWREPRLVRRHEFRKVQQRLRDASEARRVANAPLLPPQRLHHRHSRPTLQTAHQPAEAIEQRDDTSIRVGEIRHANDASITANEWCDVRATQHDRPTAALHAKAELSLGHAPNAGAPLLRREELVRPGGDDLVQRGHRVSLPS
jgi:hypothetical protein